MKTTLPYFPGRFQNPAPFLLIDTTDGSKISSNPYQRQPIPPFIFHEHSL